MTQKVATELKMKSGLETTSLGQIAAVTAKMRISDKELVWLFYHQSECQEEVWCSIHEMLTEKLQNNNGFFTTHRHAPFLKFRQGKEFSFNFRQRREAFKHRHETF